MRNKIQIIIMSLIVTILLVGIGYELIPKAQPQSEVISPLRSPTSFQYNPSETKLLSLVNDVRSKNNVAPLTIDPLLDKSAQWKADDEVTYQYTDHFRPGTTANVGLDYLISLHPSCSYISENLYSGNIGSGEFQGTEAGAINGWVNSPAHFKAMIDPSYTTTGFGFARNGYNELYVEHFCRP